MCMFVKQDKCCLVLSLHKGARLIALWTIVEFIAFWIALLVSRQWLGLGLATGLKAALAILYTALLLVKNTTGLRKAAFTGFVAEMLLQIIIVMALLILVSFKYSQSPNCSKEPTSDDWDLTEEENGSFMKAIDDCVDMVKLSSTVYTLMYLLATLPVRFWMAWNLREYANEKPVQET